MTKKPATIFDFINGMTHEKKEWSKYTETDHKKFSPFIVNRWLSMRMELIEIINQLQKYTIGLLTPRDTYRLYHGLLPAQRTFAKYIKGKKEDKYDKQLVSQIADHTDRSHTAEIRSSAGRIRYSDIQRSERVASVGV